MAGDHEVVAGELMVDGRARGFALRLSQGASGEIPLVLVLHGNHPDAGGVIMREWTTFDKQADTWGLAVAYPDGYGGCWADGRGVTTADEAGVDDVTFLRAIIDWSAERHGTSPGRTVVAGVSNGAFMAHRPGSYDVQAGPPALLPTVARRRRPTVGETPAGLGFSCHGHPVGHAAYDVLCALGLVRDGGG